MSVLWYTNVHISTHAFMNNRPQTDKTNFRFLNVCFPQNVGGTPKREIESMHIKPELWAFY